MIRVFELLRKQIQTLLILVIPRSPFALAVLCPAISLGDTPGRGGGGGSLGISGWGCAARTLEPLGYAKVSFSWILLPYTRVNSPNHYYPRQLIISSSVL